MESSSSAESICIKAEPCEDECIMEVSVKVESLLDNVVVDVKDEPPWEDVSINAEPWDESVKESVGVSAGAAAAGLYADHGVKDELVLGPELVEVERRVRDILTGRCKPASEDASATSAECGWNKSELPSVGTSLKFVKAKDLYSTPKPKPTQPNNTNAVSFLTIVQNQCKIVGDTENHLMKFYAEPSDVEKMSIHQLMISRRTRDPYDFIEYCKQFMTANACSDAELETLERNNCPMWHELRYGRISASKAYDAAHCKVIVETLTESIIGAKELWDTEPMKRRRMLKNIVLEVVEHLKKIKIKKCGLKLNATCPFMCASPDGESEQYCVEVKCPTAEKSASRYITAGGKLVEKYMEQMQLQMYFSNKTMALFCVARYDFDTIRNLDIIEVDYDRALCRDLIEKCNLFWNKAIFPAINKFQR